LVITLIGVAGLTTGFVGARAVAGEAIDRAAMEQVIHDYLLAHPEVIPEAMMKLQERRAAIAIAAERSAIETPFAGAWAGNPKPRVTLVMFSDYSCGYCRASAPAIDRLLAEEPDLKVVWREIPVLGAQSVVAARAALGAARQNHYPGFHRGLFAAGRPDDAAIAAVARANQLDPKTVVEGGKSDDVTREIAGNLKLAARLGIDGTPAFVIGDQLLSGAVGHDALKAAVAAARSKG
jgi:protein-disulfide isomerase